MGYGKFGMFRANQRQTTARASGCHRCFVPHAKTTRLEASEKLSSHARSTRNASSWSLSLFPIETSPLHPQHSSHRNRGLVPVTFSRSHPSTDAWKALNSLGHKASRLSTRLRPPESFCLSPSRQQCRRYMPPTLSLTLRSSRSHKIGFPHNLTPRQRWTSAYPLTFRFLRRQ